LTGNSTDGEGGSIEIASGKSSGEADGANIQISAGESSGDRTTGGTVTLFGGHGSSNDRYDGGNGGSIELIAGSGHGHNQATDVGGDIYLQAGYSLKSSGGNVFLKSGPSIEGDSGEVTIASENSGKRGTSGMLNITTGFAMEESSGKIDMSTGTSHSSHGGNIELKVGDGNVGDGGDLIAIAGSTKDMACEYLCICLCKIEGLSLHESHISCFLLSTSHSASGGSVLLQGGQGQHSSPHDGSDGGSVLLMGGESRGLGWHDHGGSIELTAGTARRGTGGDVFVSSCCATILYYIFDV